MLFPPALLGQDMLCCPVDLRQEPILACDLGSIWSRPPDDTYAWNRWSRCRLFRMPVGLASDLLALDTEGDASFNCADVSPPPADLLADTRLQVALGTDNPYIDFRRPGDWGGIGYYRLHSQVLLLDSEATSLCMGLKAITPAGLEAGGVANGPTVLTPNFAWFYELGRGTAVQAFVGKSVHAHANWTDGLQRDVHYGLALQSPFPGFDDRPNPKAHLFLEAVGRNRFESDLSQRSPRDLDLVPGIHWRWRDACWISGGCLMPLDAWSPANLQWQLTCSWQF
jgi:hypothetical protein